MARSQNTDAKLLIYRLFQEGRVLAQDAVAGDRSVPLGSSATMFQVGDLVVLRSDPGSVVPIVEVMPGGAEIPSCPKIRTEPETSYVNS